MKVIFLAVAALSPLASAAASDTAPVNAPQAIAAAAPPTEVVGEGPDKVICRREKALGSRITAKRICQTAAEWERQRRDDQQLAEKVQSGRWKSN